MNGDFVPNSVLKDLKMGEFDNLDKSIKKKMVKLMARISEASYRRGFQHGKELPETVNPLTLRCKFNLHVSPRVNAFGLNGKWCDTKHSCSIERLFIEYPLTQVGFINPQFANSE